jgi:hypothetical protein
MDIPSDIEKFISDLATNAIRFATVMAAIGVVTMAMIQTVKDLLPVRRWFQRNFLRKWLGGSSKNIDECENDLVKLATAGDIDAFYDLAIEQLCGQMNVAAQIVIEYPKLHEALLRCLAKDADPADIDAVLHPPDYISLERNTLTREQQENVTKVFDARNRLTHQIQRNIDALQISMGFRWKLWLQIASFVISFVLAFIAVAGARSVWLAILLGGIAGFVAPVARDLVAALQQLRKP